MTWLKQSTQASVVVGPFLATSDGYSSCTGLTVNQALIRISKNGLAYAQANSASSASHDESGNYRAVLSTTDTNTVGRLRLSVSAASALPVWHDFLVLPAATYDALVSGTACLPVAVAASLAASSITACAFASGAIDTVAIAASAISQTDIAQSAYTTIADYLLDRNVAGSSTGGRTVKEALFALRNRVGLSGTTVTVYGVNDTSACWTATVTTGAASGITNFDPA